MHELLDRLYADFLATVGDPPNSVECGLEMIAEVESWLAARGLTNVELYGSFEMELGSVSFNYAPGTNGEDFAT